MFHVEQFDSTGVSDVSKSDQQVEHTASSQKCNYYGVEGFSHAQDEPGFSMSHHQLFQQQHLEEFANLDDQYLDAVTPIFQLCEDEIRKIVGVESENTELVEHQKRESCDVPHEPFAVLRKFRSTCLKLDEQLLSTRHMVQSTQVVSPSLSTETIIEAAAEKFIQSTCQSNKELSMLNHPYPVSLLAHSREDSKEVELVQNILFCAEKVAYKQYERAIKLLKDCDKVSSCTGTPIQRLVFYLSEALFEKIAVETGRIMPKELEKLQVDPLESVMFPNLTLRIAFHRQYPLSQITQLVGIQAILDHLEEARKVHTIDLEIRSGVQWIILMQVLAARSERPIEHLKITAVGTKWKSVMEQTGRQLASFAQSLNLKFTFKIVFVEDFLSLDQYLFDLDADESVAVYAPYILTTMIGSVDWLYHLMEVIRNMSPCVMVVSEVEANCNSPTFIERFVESLFFFGAFFNSLGECFKNDESNRRNVESSWFRSSIRNILAAEGEKRKIRRVDIKSLESIFVRLGLVEIELSMSSLDQATLGLQGFPLWELLRIIYRW